jgi:ABC-2 type transport system ATP-binding protein
MNNYRSCKKKMGLCPQDLVIWESLTCMEQLLFMGHSYSLGRRKARQRALELLHLLGLSNKKSKLAKTLSGGMKRRLNIALALVHEPDILILDEPQAGLDPQSRILVRDYIRSLAKKITVVLTTHDMDEAERLSDRIAIIDHGHLLVLDTAENLKQQIGEGDFLEVKLLKPTSEQLSALQKNLPGHLNQFHSHEDTIRLTGNDLFNDIPLIISSINKSGLTILNASIRGITLEDVFIHLTGRRLRE